MVVTASTWGLRNRGSPLKKDFRFIRTSHCSCEAATAIHQELATEDHPPPRSSVNIRRRSLHMNNPTAPMTPLGDEAAALNELTRRNVEIVAQLEKSASLERTRTDRWADSISSFVGSMGFAYIHVVWFGGWIAFFTLPFFPKAWRVDPFPFTFLTFVVSLEAIFLSTFILISQNHEERVARRT
jgi:hypothetical protein